MAQKFNNGDDNFSIRTKLNATADEVNTSTLDIIALQQTKVDEVTGKALSDENYTAAEKAKLANLNDYFVGEYISLAALQLEHPSGAAGEYATVDVAGSDALRYIWDVTDSKWVSGGTGVVTSVNGQVGPVSLDTDTIPEGTKKYSTASLVLGYILNGFTSTASSTPAAATDSILQGISKLASNIKDLYDKLTGKVGQQEVDDSIDTALESTKLFFDSATFEGAVIPVPGPNDPQVGTEDNPLKSKGTQVIVDNVVEDGNLNAVSSNAVFNAIGAVKGGSNMSIKEVYDNLYALIASGNTTPVPPSNIIVNNTAKTLGFTNTNGLTNSDTEKTFDGGLIIAANTVNPFPVPNDDFPINTVGVRYKAATGRNPSNWTFNQTPYTKDIVPTGNFMAGFNPVVFTTLQNYEQKTVGIWGPAVDNNGGSGVPTQRFNTSFSFAFRIVDPPSLNVETDFGLTKVGVGNNNINGVRISKTDLRLLDNGGPNLITSYSPVIGDWVVFKYIQLGTSRQLKLFTSTDGLNLIERAMPYAMNNMDDAQWYLVAITEPNSRFYYPQFRMD